VFFRQPSTVLQPSGAAVPVDQGGLGFAQSNWTSAGAGATSRSSFCVAMCASQRHTLKCMPPGDDDDDDVDNYNRR